MRLFLILPFSLLYSTTTLAFDASNEFPKLFRGVWDASLKACSSKWSDARLKIGKNSIEYLESVGQIIEIIQTNDLELQVKLSMIGEGEKWVKTAIYKLSNSSRNITEYFDDYNNFSRVRCTSMHNKS